MNSVRCQDPFVGHVKKSHFCDQFFLILEIFSYIYVYHMCAYCWIIGTVITYFHRIRAPNLPFGTEFWFFFNISEIPRILVVSYPNKITVHTRCYRTIMTWDRFGADIIFANKLRPPSADGLALHVYVIVYCTNLCHHSSCPVLPLECSTRISVKMNVWNKPAWNKRKQYTVYLLIVIALL